LPRDPTMLPLRKEQIALLAKLLGDLANLAAAAFIFGQCIRAQAFSVAALVAGIVIWLLLAYVAVSVAGRGPA
jgi:hypothetical protein